MFNPYEVMYDSTMDVYRYQGTKDEAGFDISAEVCVASGIKCRYSALDFNSIPAGTAGNPATVKGAGKNGSMNVKLEDEDVDYLRELAERDYVARIAQNTLAPNIQITFTGDINREMDYEKIGPAVAQILQDEIDTAPEGLY